MGKSSSLRVEDVRAILQLIGECRELGDDHVAWRTHFMASTCKLSGAEWCEFGETIVIRGGVSQPIWGDLWGPRYSSQTKTYSEIQKRFLAEGIDWSPMMPPYSQELAKDGEVSLSRKDLVSDQDWDLSPFYQEAVRLLGAQELLYCHRAVNGDNRKMRFLTFLRAPGNRHFSGRDCTIVREAHTAISSLIGTILAGPQEPSPSALSPRCRQVLRCMLEGESNKQISKRLGISENTVNQYAKLIHAHFGVRSRTELMARWVRRAGYRWPWAEDE
jgi:DNA-binding CsgD family transcriptional regulator